MAKIESSMNTWNDNEQEFEKTVSHHKIQSSVTIRSALFPAALVKVHHPIPGVATGLQGVAHDCEIHMIHSDSFRVDHGREMFEYCRLNLGIIQDNLNSWRWIMQYGMPWSWDDITYYYDFR